jgi:hypothetical protein
MEGWRNLVRNPFFRSAVLESRPPIAGQRLIGFGASVLLSAAFAEAELANPLPDINSRVVASLFTGRSALATRAEVAAANAADGVNVLVLCGGWRDDIVNAAERQDVQTILASSFTESHAGFRIRRILAETADEAARDFVARSIVYRAIAEFPDMGRVLHLMTLESVRAVPASLGNILFSYREPVLRLRASDQELLSEALGGATDPELAAKLGIKTSAVKARWRSTFIRVAETMPELASGFDDQEGRGAQKRHRVLAYVRNHPEELRPYEWKVKIRAQSA